MRRKEKCIPDSSETLPKLCGRFRGRASFSKVSEPARMRPADSRMGSSRIDDRDRDCSPPKTRSSGFSLFTDDTMPRGKNIPANVCSLSRLTTLDDN